MACVSGALLPLLAANAEKYPVSVFLHNGSGKPAGNLQSDWDILFCLAAVNIRRELPTLG